MNIYKKDIKYYAFIFFYPVLFLSFSLLGKNLSSSYLFDIRDGQFYNIMTQCKPFSRFFNGIDSYGKGVLKYNSGTCSFLLWIKPEGNGTLICRPGFNNYIAYLNNKFEFKIWSEDKKSLSIISKAEYPPLKWYFVAGVWNDENCTMSLYVNGEKIEVKKSIKKSRAYGKSLYIACTCPGKNVFKGQIGDAKVYGIALDAANVKKIYESTHTDYSTIKKNETFSYKGWKIDFEQSDKILKSLSYEGLEVLSHSNISELSIQLGGRHWRSPAPDKLILNKDNGSVTMIYHVDNFAIRQIITLNAIRKHHALLRH